MPNPFIISGRIERPEDFVGRKAELQYIFSRLESVAQTGQPQSISVVGPRRIGKSSLLCHLSRVYTEHLSRPDAYLFACLDLESAACQTLPGLLGAILEALLGQLGERGKVAQKLQDRLRAIKSGEAIALVEFEETIKEIGWLPGPRRWPVICLDEFERLVEVPEEFTVSVYHSWRSLISANQVAFITASMRPLPDLAQLGSLTSPFFNVFDRTLLPLGEWTSAEAEELLERGRRSDCPFDATECKSILKLAGYHPWHLQIAASLAYEAKAGGQAVDWGEVKRRFQQQVSPPRPRSHRQATLAGKGVHQMSARVGRLVLQTGQGLLKLAGKIDQILAVMIVMAIVLVVVLVLLGYLPVEQVVEWIKGVLGIE